MPIRHHDSLRLRLASEGRLSNAVRREAFPLLERLYNRIQPALWREQDAVASGIIDEEGQRQHRLSSEAERTRNPHAWFSRSLDFIERDKELATALAARAAGKGDNELPEAMQRPQPMSEMAKLYAGFADTIYADGDVEQPMHSALRLRDAPVLSNDAPREGGGLLQQRQAAAPEQTQTPNRDVLSLSELSKKLLPRHLQIPEKSDVSSKTVALPARQTW
jgi:hypothetical protein